MRRRPSRSKAPSPTSFPQSRSASRRSASSSAIRPLTTPTLSHPASIATHWNAGIELAIKKLTLDFRYWGTSIAGDEAANEFFELAGDGEEGLADDRFVFTVTCTLP